ncbi:hypothetical protein ACOSP7_007298 [Xanthoceras sorbifolium]
MCLARKGTVSMVIWSTKVLQMSDKEEVSLNVQPLIPGGKSTQTRQKVVQNGTTDLNSSKLSLVTLSSFGDNIMLIVALCFHSVFEGLELRKQKLIHGKLCG